MTFIIVSFVSFDVSHPVYFFLVVRSCGEERRVAEIFLLAERPRSRHLIIGGAVPRTLAGW
jgi:hypothetical protein